jgi:hypothetical protein
MPRSRGGVTLSRLGLREADTQRDTAKIKTPMVKMPATPVPATMRSANLSAMLSQRQ